jgi:hypothetical protein
MREKRFKKLTQQEVVELISYDPESGRAFWNERDVKWFNEGKQIAQHSANAWNAQFAGKEIKSVDAFGYVVFSFFDYPVKLHRVIWFREYGTWPKIIDHINGIKNDNRLCNLREVTSEENAKNQKLSSRNKSGRVGVSLNKKDSTWKVFIMIKKKPVHLGYFASLEEAIKVRDAAEIEYGYHENHGRIMT